MAFVFGLAFVVVLVGTRVWARTRASRALAA
jgi:hypothetical protein